jgi:hypothetical protein
MILSFFMPSGNSNSSETGLPGAGVPRVVSEMEEIGTQTDFVTSGFLDNINHDTNSSNCLKDITYTRIWLG